MGERLGLRCTFPHAGYGTPRPSWMWEHTSQCGAGQSCVAAWLHWPGGVEYRHRLPQHSVRELVSDYASQQYYSNRAKYGSARTYPTGPDAGQFRTVCGGHFRYVSSQVLRRRPFTGHRPHYRGFGLGFRLRRSLP